MIFQCFNLAAIYFSLRCTLVTLPHGKTVNSSTFKYNTTRTKKASHPGGSSPYSASTGDHSPPVAIRELNLNICPFTQTTSSLVNSKFLTKKRASISLLEKEVIVLLSHEMTWQTSRLERNGVVCNSINFLRQCRNTSNKHMAPLIQDKMTILCSPALVKQQVFLCIRNRFSMKSVHSSCYHCNKVKICVTTWNIIKIKKDNTNLIRKGNT